jgi:plastocyanin domain-containing protein
MINKITMFASIAALSVVLSLMSGGAVAQMEHKAVQQSATEQTGEFQRIDQPLWVKGVVTAGGLGLVGLELWWFLLSKPKSRKAMTHGGVQEVTVVVDGGYEPSQIVVQVGQLVRLKFDRKDPSSCLDEVRFPAFRIAQALPLNQTTAIEFTPDQPGRYEFTCGMNMFRGVVDVQPAEGPTAIAPLPQPAYQAGHETKTRGNY